MKDFFGNTIKEGDIVFNLEATFALRVKLGGTGELYGELICNQGHSCKGIPYSLNDGSEYVKMSWVKELVISYFRTKALLRKEINNSSDIIESLGTQ